MVWDPGYSLCKRETTGHRLTKAGIEQTIQLVTHQRGIRPFAGEAMLVDGQLYSNLLPKDLRDLTFPPRFAPGPYRRAFEEKFNRRARWRFVRHAKPDSDGVTRWPPQTERPAPELLDQQPNFGVTGGRLRTKAVTYSALPLRQVDLTGTSP